MSAESTKRVKTNIQASRKESDAATLHALRFNRKEKAAEFWVCVQQQFENINTANHCDFT